MRLTASGENLLRTRLRKPRLGEHQHDLLDQASTNLLYLFDGLFLSRALISARPELLSAASPIVCPSASSSPVPLVSCTGSCFYTDVQATLRRLLARPGWRDSARGVQLQEWAARKILADLVYEAGEW